MRARSPFPMKRVRAVPRHEPGRMNKTELRYSHELTAKGRPWIFESITLYLAKDTRYTADFAVEGEDGVLEMHETKGGFVRDDAWVKLKVAARLYPWFRFYLVRFNTATRLFERTEVPAL